MVFFLYSQTGKTENEKALDVFFPIHGRVWIPYKEQFEFYLSQIAESKKVLGAIFPQDSYTVSRT